MHAISDCLQNEKSGLTLVCSNPQPKRELGRPNRWLLHSRDGSTFNLLVSHDNLNRPRVICKEAA
jgi:hypothetical protein